ncbi:hypothetical protein ACFX2G_028181 [Malus domestica]
MEVVPVVMTYIAMGHKLLELASEVKDSRYLLGLSLGALSEAKVITGSCLMCSYSFDRFDAVVEGTVGKVFALLQVVTPKVPPLTARMPLFFSLVARTV